MRSRSLWSCALAVVVSAASPEFWTVATQAEFLKGDVEDLSIDSDGRVFLGPSPALVAETAAPFLWTVLALPDGTLFAGSGNEGKVLRVGRDGKMSTFFDAAELEVHAIAPAPGGGLYVATSPDGKIYQVAPDGTSKTFFDPDDKYIWALAVDGAGNVFAATGDKGVIYKITPAGAGTPFLQDEHHQRRVAGVRAVGRSDRRHGIARPGLQAGCLGQSVRAARLALPRDSRGTRGVRRDHLRRRDERRRRRPSGRSPAGCRVRPAARAHRLDGDHDCRRSRQSPVVRQRPASTTRPRRGGRGTIYRIRPDGFWDPLWETGDDAPYDLLIEPGGSLLVGTGTDGKIFRITGDPARATLVTRAAARQVTALLRESSGPDHRRHQQPRKARRPRRRCRQARHLRVRRSRRRHDGELGCHSMARGRAARSGPDLHAQRQHRHAGRNVEQLVGVYTNADGEQMTSPNARYLQWRAVLTGDATGSPALTSVTAAYLPRNLRPEVVSITVHPAGTVFQRPFSTGELEIAGFEDNTSDNRQLTESPPPACRIRALVAHPGAREAYLPEGTADARLEG